MNLNLYDHFDELSFEQDAVGMAIENPSQNTGRRFVEITYSTTCSDSHRLIANLTGRSSILSVVVLRLYGVGARRRSADLAGHLRGLF